MATYKDNPDKPLNELLTNALVNVYVGEENTHWILHERLLTYHSPHFYRVFHSPDFEASKTKSYGLPDVEDGPFELFVGWLYSKAIRPPTQEKEIGPLLDLYFLADKLEIEALGIEVVEATRNFYLTHQSYPGLRRVQYVYANTSEDNELREMMVGAIARYLTLSSSIPKHWENALKNNGQLSVDIIRSIQQWHLEGRSVPDVRDATFMESKSDIGFAPVAGGDSMDARIKKEEAAEENDDDQADVSSGLNGSVNE